MCHFIEVKRHWWIADMLVSVLFWTGLNQANSERIMESERSVGVCIGSDKPSSML
jgi:hypothetical protein